MLVRSCALQAGISLLSNVCRHRQAVMLKGRGDTRNSIVCPLHRWTYGLDGKLLGAPHFPDNPCLDLGARRCRTGTACCSTQARRRARPRPTSAWRRRPRLHGLHARPREMHEYDYNWKTFIEVYLEDYHVGPFHPGSGSFVTCDDLRWEFGDWYTRADVGVNKRLARPARRRIEMARRVLRLPQRRPPPHGAIWLTYYPNVMVEWYPHVLVSRRCIPRGPEKTLNVVEFYYPEEIALFEREFVAAQQAAYSETAVEDEEIARA